MKQNKKGFTLVELIVVMAIIAVLAAILVPTMLGFMNNAKFTQANANAKTIHTAFSSVISDYCTDNPVLTGEQGLTISSVDATAGAGSSDTPVAGEMTLDSVVFDPMSEDDAFNMTQYLDGMKGNCYVEINASGTGVAFVTWSLGTPGEAQVSKANQKASRATGEDANDNPAYDESGNPVGCYPLAD